MEEVVADTHETTVCLTFQDITLAGSAAVDSIQTDGFYVICREQHTLTCHPRVLSKDPGTNVDRFSDLNTNRLVAIYSLP